MSRFRDEAGEEQAGGDDEERPDRDQFDQGEPEFRFAEVLDRHHVQDEQQQRQHRGGQPLRHLRPPELGVSGDGGQVTHGRHDPGEPVGPSGDEPARRPENVLGYVAEGLVLQVRQEHLTHGPHHEVQEETDHGVDQHAGGARLVDGVAGPHEHAGADGTAQGHQLQVTVAQAALQPLPVLVDIALDHHVIGRIIRGVTHLGTPSFCVGVSSATRAEPVPGGDIVHGLPVATFRTWGEVLADNRPP